jgi:hypothetical protein
MPLCGKGMASSSIIVWRRLDEVGLDYCELKSSDVAHCVSGAIVGIEAARRYRIAYSVQCDPQWRARAARIKAVIDGEQKNLRLEASQDGLWKISGQAAEQLFGCQDIDLAFSPATNAFAIRRLNLAVGAVGHSRAAWVEFPSLSVSILEQTYRRLSEYTYNYQTDDGGFETTLTVNGQGLVTSYPPFWEKVA